MTIKEKVFLIAGSNFAQRKSALDNIKSKFLGNRQEAGSVVTIYCDGIELKKLQEELLNFSFQGEKLVIFKNSEKLSREAVEFLAANIEKIVSYSCLVFDLDKDYASFEQGKRTKDFFGFIAENASIIKTAPAPQRLNVDDLLQSLRRNDLPACLYILEKLLEDKNKEMEIGPLLVGVLVSRVAYASDPVKKEKYLNYLWQADRGIKEKGHDVKMVLNTLLVKMLRP